MMRTCLIQSLAFAVALLSGVRALAFGESPEFAVSPAQVAAKLSELFLSTSPDFYKPAGYRAPKACGHEDVVHYSVVSLWVNALECARLAGNADLEKRLVAASIAFCMLGAGLGVCGMVAYGIHWADQVKSDAVAEAKKAAEKNGDGKGNLSKSGSDHQSTILQCGYGIAAVHSAHFLDHGTGNRLIIGNDCQRFQSRLREHRRLSLFQGFYDQLCVLRSRAELQHIVHPQQSDPSPFAVVLVRQLFGRPLSPAAKSTASSALFKSVMILPQNSPVPFQFQCQSRKNAG